MRKKLSPDQLKIRHVRWALVAMVVFFISVFVLSWWQIGRITEEKIVKRIETQELLTARSCALSIGEYLKPKVVSLLILSESMAIKEGRQEEGEKLIKTLIKEVKGEPLIDVLWLDKEGDALWSTNLRGERVREEIYFGESNYFEWAQAQKEPGEIFMSKPFVSREGERGPESIFIIAASVLNQGRFNGLVLMSFSIAELTEKYLTPLVFDPKVYLYMVAFKEGVIVATTKEELIGENIFQYIEKSDWPEEEKESFLKLITESLEGEEGTIVGQRNFFSPEKSRLITAYSPVKVGDQVWSLWISLPYEEAVKEMSVIRGVQVGELMIVLIGITILILVLNLGLRVAQRDAFVDGFRNGRDGIKKMKKKN